MIFFISQNKDRRGINTIISCEARRNNHSQRLSIFGTDFVRLYHVKSPVVHIQYSQHSYYISRLCDHTRMTGIPVDKLMSILDIFRIQPTETGMSKNQVYRATGIKNKGPILAALNLLVKDKILASKKANKQKEILTLTPLGQEIIDLITDINAANEAYEELDSKISEYESLNEKAFFAFNKIGGERYHEVLRSKLRRKGWDDKEIEIFDEIMESICSIEKIYRKNICNSLIQRYSLITSNFKIYDNVREILTKIIITQITHVLSLRTHYYDRGPVLAPYELNRFDDLGLVIHQEICTLYNQNHMVLRFTSNETKNLMTSILAIVRLNRNLVSRYIKIFDDDLKRLMEQVDESKEKNIAFDITEIEPKIEVLNQLRQIYLDINARYEIYEAEAERRRRQIVESHDFQGVNVGGF